MLLKLKSSLSFFIVLLLAVFELDAQIIYNDITDDSISYQSGLGGGKQYTNYSIDVNNDNIVDLEFQLMIERYSPSPTSNVTDLVSQLYARNNGKILVEPGSGWRMVPNCSKPLAGGDSIHSIGSWNSHSEIYVSVPGVGISCSLPVNDLYYGFKFNIGNSSHFGWLNLDVDNIGNIVLKSYAYNATPNQLILAGDTTNAAVSIQENYDENELMSLYPVPFSDFLNIDIKNIQAPFQIYLSNIKGQVVKEFQEETNNFTCSLSNLDRGFYILTISNTDGVFIRRKISKY